MTTYDTMTETPAASRSVATRFVGFGVTCLLIGMAWGIQMSATHDHTLSAAHAHLNLLGWAVMGAAGLYYAVTPSAAASRLARVHFWVAALGVVLIVPGIVLAVTERGELLAVAGSFVTLAAGALFAWQVLRHGVGRG